MSNQKFEDTPVAETAPATNHRHLVACMTHQLFGVLAHRKQELATPGYALQPSGIWDITLSEIFTLECDWRSRFALGGMGPS